MTIKEAFDLSLRLKEKLINNRTKSNYENRITNFLKWLGENHHELKDINELSKKIVNQFLNDELLGTSARSSNNFRVD